MRIRIPFAALCLLAAPASAREHAPRVVSPHRADAYSMKTFAEFPRWRGLRGDALAWEVYQYLADTHSGLFHVNEVLEGDDALGEYRIVRDPVKIINVYGYGFCGLLGPVMAGVWEDMGGGPARTVTLPDWAHVVSEVFYDDTWHYVDVDVRAVFRRADGSLASLADARREPRVVGQSRAAVLSQRSAGTDPAGLRANASGKLLRIQPERPHAGLRAAARRELHPLVDTAGRPLEPSPRLEPRRLAAAADRTGTARAETQPSGFHRSQLRQRPIHLPARI